MITDRDLTTIRQGLGQAAGLVLTSWAHPTAHIRHDPRRPVTLCGRDIPSTFAPVLPPSPKHRLCTNCQRTLDNDFPMRQSVNA